MKSFKYLITIVLLLSVVHLSAQNDANKTFQGKDNHSYTPLTNKTSNAVTQKGIPGESQQKNSDSRPQFPGGEAALQEYIRRNLNTHISDEELDGDGRVSLAFKVNANGQISNIKILNSLGYAYDKEAVRLVRAMPYWIPGMENGRPVTMDYSISIAFSAQNTNAGNAHDYIYTPAGRVNTGTPTAPQATSATPKGNNDRVTVEVLAANVQTAQPITDNNETTKRPEFPGGEDALWNYFEDNVDQKLADGKGNVTVSFVVEVDGSIGEAKIVEGVGYIYDREALRLVQSMPTWIPALRQGTKVPYKVTLEIPF